MILTDALEQHGYAQLLIADYHLEYPLEPYHNAKVELVWQPFAISQISYYLDPEQDAVAADDRVTAFEEVMFGPLVKKYGWHYEPGMNLWQLQGNLNDLAGVQNKLAFSLMGGSGGDDDTYDYWPNAFEMLVVLTHDLINLGYKHPNFLIDRVERVIKSAIALNGPLAEWEAEDLPNMLNSLKEAVA